MNNLDKIKVDLCSLFSTNLVKTYLYADASSGGGKRQNFPSSLPSGGLQVDK